MLRGSTSQTDRVSVLIRRCSRVLAAEAEVPGRDAYVDCLACSGGLLPSAEVSALVLPPRMQRNPGWEVRRRPTEPCERRIGSTGGSRAQWLLPVCCPRTQRRAPDARGRILGPGLTCGDSWWARQGLNL